MGYMSKYIRNGNTTYSANFSNNLVTKSGCKGTICNIDAANGKFTQYGGLQSKGPTSFTEVMNQRQGVSEQLSKVSTKGLAQRFGNNVPSQSPKLEKADALFLKNNATKNKVPQKGGAKSRKCPKGKKYCKWGKSKTMKRREDFTTKKSSNMYNEKRLKRLIGRKTMRAPIFKFIGGVGKKGYSHPKKRQGSLTMKGKEDFTTKKGNKFFNRQGHRQTHAK